MSRPVNSNPITLEPTPGAALNAPPLRIMLVDDDTLRRGQVEQALGVHGHEIAVRLDTSANLHDAVKRYTPDLILIDVDAPSRDTLESLSRITSDYPRPIVMFADEGDGDTIRRAVRAGVSAYVVDGLAVQRLRPIIEVAIARFHEYQALRRELDETRTRLADRKDVDRAKGLLMERRKLNETQAYELLRRMAMDRGMKLGDASRALIAAADLL